MPRPSNWANNNREKLREYSKQWRKTHLDYFKRYERKNWLKLKIQRKLWMKKNRTKYLDCYTRDQRREYLRNWREKRKQEKQWGISYLNSLITQ